jgi:hypothetical protein
MTGAPSRRVPAVVVVSSVLLCLAGLARLGQVAAEAVRQDTYLAAHDQAGTPEGWSALSLVFLMAVGLVVALTAASQVVLGVVNLAGANWTRVATFVIGCLTLTVVAGFLLLSGVPTDELPGTGADALARQLMPGWVGPVATVSGYVASPALLIAVVLLALPAASDFFLARRPVVG